MSDGVHPFGATFLAFSDYARLAIRPSRRRRSSWE